MEDASKIRAISNSDSETFTPQTCAQPTIDSIAVDGQPISQLVVGRSGNISIIGACLDSTTQVSVSFNPSGNSGSSGGSQLASPVSIGTVTPSVYGAVNAQYSVAPGATPGSVNLVVSTAGGSTSANLDVVPSPGIYIDSITPSVWPANSSTTVVIVGSGFGTVEGNLTLAPNIPGDAPLQYVQSWSDNMIVMQVATGSGPDTVT